MRFLLCSLWWSLFSASAANKPHIIMMVLDDLGWNDLGYRSTHVQTPELNRLESEGVSLLNYYGMSSCAPTRSTLMTGRHVTRTGIYTPFAGNMPEGVPLTETFLPQKLKRLGYATHMVGKWHLGFYKAEYTPTFRGFDSFYGFYGWGEDYFKHTSSYPTPGGKTKSGYDFRDEARSKCGENCSKVDYGAAGKYSTNLFAERAVKIIQAHNTSVPLFMYLPWQAVHAPRMVPSKYAAPYQGGPRNADFCGMVAAADEGVANVTAALVAQGMIDNTVIIVSADNGGPVDDSTTPGVHEGDAIGASNYPLRAGKHSIFEGGTRLTAFVWAKQLSPRKHYGLMHTVDWYATLVTLAGGSEASLAELSIDGKDQWNSFETGRSPYDIMFLGCQHSGMWQYPVCAMRLGDWKFIVGDPHAPYGWSPSAPASEAAAGEELYGYGLVALDKFRNASGFQPGSLLLYNVTSTLTGDVGERNDLSKMYPKVVEKFLNGFKAWNESRVPYDYAMDKRAPKGTPINGVWGPWVQGSKDVFVV